MEHPILFVGLALSFAGAVVVTMADAWLSRLLLIYFDTVEANVTKVVEAVRAGRTEFTVTGIDLKQDRRLDRARNFKTIGWLTVVLGMGLQLISAWMSRPPA